MIRLILLLLISIGHQSFAGTIDPNIPDNTYIRYAKDFKYIYKICGTDNDGKLFCASAVAIDSHWILTAAHVVKNHRTCIIHKEEKAYEVTDIIIHKDFDDDKFGGSDIAIGYIKEDLGLDFYPSLYEEKDEIGKACTISGFGFTGNFNTGSVKHDGNQRAGTNTIDSIENNFLICSPSRKNKTPLEFLIASGDSGGGLFIGNKLAGINSCVLASDRKPDSTYGDESGHTRISIHHEWIKEIIANHEKKK